MIRPADVQFGSGKPSPCGRFCGESSGKLLFSKASGAALRFGVVVVCSARAKGEFMGAKLCVRSLVHVRPMPLGLSLRNGLSLRGVAAVGWLMAASLGAAGAWAADLYFDMNGATPFGDGSRVWQQSNTTTNNPYWTTSPLGDIATTNYATSNGTKSAQFGFGPAPENPGGGGTVTVGNSSNPGSNNPTAG